MFCCFILTKYEKIEDTSSRGYVVIVFKKEHSCFFFSIKVFYSNYRKMNVFSFLFLSICFVVWVDVIVADKNKLQIGVKKKVENCSKRSKNGDVLKMHYTVSYCCYRFLLL